MAHHAHRIGLSLSRRGVDRRFLPAAPGAVADRSKTSKEPSKRNLVLSILILGSEEAEYRQPEIRRNDERGERGGLVGKARRKALVDEIDLMHQQQHPVRHEKARGGGEKP